MIIERDEYAHQWVQTEKMWKENMWLSVVDRAANIFGVNHFAITNKGHTRFCALFLIDGVDRSWCFKKEISAEHAPEKLTDGYMTYEVVNPFKDLHLTFDGPDFGFDLRYEGRFPVFDYDRCIDGSPFKKIHPDCAFDHFEQGLTCRGDFEVRRGPQKGLRKIDCYAHRDHSWGIRIEGGEGVDDVRPGGYGHFWPSIQTDSFHLNAAGGLVTVPGRKVIGGFLSDRGGSRPIKDASVEACFEPETRIARSFRYTITLPDDRVIHVRTGRKYGQVILCLRGINDVESVYDCYEPFFDFEIEETGERGYGVCEYGFVPRAPIRI